MSNLKQKSGFNKDAAEVLFTQGLFAPSVHCSYYSCFQLLKYIINDFFGVDYDVQAIEMRSEKLGSHQYVIKYINTQLKTLTDLKERRDFIRKIKDLKDYRLNSDYENISIDSDIGNRAIKKANEIRTYIEEKFQ